MAQILTVDDDPDIRELIVHVLQHHGFDVECIHSGSAALELLDARDDATRPALVVLDVQMPDLDGWDTLRGIRARPHTAQLPVILCTVKASPADVELGRSLGCNGYIAKPFAIADLVGEVHTVLRRYGLGPSRPSPVAS